MSLGRFGSFYRSKRRENVQKDIEHGNRDDYDAGGYSPVSMCNAVETSQKIDPSSAHLVEFFKKVRIIQINLLKLKNLFQSLQVFYYKHQKIMNTEMKEQLKNNLVEIKYVKDKLKDLMLDLHEDNDNFTTNHISTVGIEDEDINIDPIVEIRNNQYQKLLDAYHNLVNVISTFKKKIDQKYPKNVKQQTRCLPIDNEKESIDKSKKNDSSESSAQTEQYRKIKDIESMVKELFQLFKEMELFLKTHDERIKKIDQNVERVNDFAKRSKGHLEASKHLQKGIRSRRRMYIVSVTLFMIAVALLTYCMFIIVFPGMLGSIDRITKGDTGDKEIIHIVNTGENGNSLPKENIQQEPMQNMPDPASVQI